MTQSTAAPAPPLLGPFGTRAIRVGRLLGIEIGIDPSWLLIFALVTVALAGRFATEQTDWPTLETWAAGILASLAFFTTIVLHELGHSVTSNRLGLPVRSITLFIFGGVARLEGKPRTPGEQFLIGGAGPLVSVIIGVVALGLAGLAPDSPPIVRMFGPILSWLGTVNLLLAAFNLFPGHPLDGGHLLRAAIWKFTGDERLATSITSRLGSAFGMFLIASGALAVLRFGALDGLWLVILGWFLMRAAQGTRVHEVLESRLAKVTVRSTMETSWARTAPEVTLEELVQHAVLERGERTFCVERDGELLGLLTLVDVKHVPASERATTRVGDVMRARADLTTVTADETVWNAMRTLDDRALNQLPVLENGRLVGLFTRERLLAVVRNQLDLGKDA